MTTPTENPFAVITGASSGIGFELARQLAEHGYDLLLVAEDEAIEEAAANLRRDGRNQVTAVRADLATYDGVERAWAAVESTGRGIDALALNAGRGIGGTFVGGTDLADELNVIDVNIKSTVHLAKRALPGMVRRGGGRVLVTSSIAAMMPGTYQAVYNASKSFTQSFAEALRAELKDTGVTVTALMPGPTDTDFFHRAEMDDTRVGAGSKDDPALVAEQGVKALLAGEEKVLAGSARTRAQAVASKVMPDRVKAAMHARMAEPGSATD
ncbi:SDR family NAD(P)-dependent oxidoreductase [Actinoplanes teichomyceticus]|uniref:Short-subunit dehydrogenase n=1 Tax=Actinoplanes teichomyceticus TaxID=1867 RepID=A0A561VC86_ACTTI|nr:SDR family NAD(P)-dependent oxidoreductase [Actinoplanes teichomyceticus]TWG09212.1 short-subunit dehydrogenase [Actinoplanes teichomyceticus]GIF16996.1 oxidoreductase [Actinoplanes teichomyceticus]